MSSALIIGLVVLAAAGWLAFAARSPLDRAIREALRSKDVAPLLDTIGERSEEEQPTAYDYAIGKLWYAYTILMKYTVDRAYTSPIMAAKRHIQSSHFHTGIIIAILAGRARPRL